MDVATTGTATGQRPQASGRKNAIRLVMLASAMRLARDKRTLQALIVAAIVVAAVARLAREGGNPLDWYFAHGQEERRSPA
jgi:hypothetical protein